MSGATSLRGESVWGTLVQSVRRLPDVLRHMRPTWHLGGIGGLSAEFIAAHDVRGIIWDVDGTLTGHGRPAIDAAVAATFEALLAQVSVRHVIVSNSPERRFRALGELFPSIPILRVYSLGDARHTRRLHRGTDSMSDAERDALLARGARALRKPHPELTRFAIRELDVPQGQVVMVGDQYFTDVAGASMGGVRSIKLPTIALESFPWSVRIAQRVEALAYLTRHGHGARSRTG